MSELPNENGILEATIGKQPDVKKAAGKENPISEDEVIGATMGKSGNQVKPESQAGKKAVEVVEFYKGADEVAEKKDSRILARLENWWSNRSIRKCDGKIKELEEKSKSEGQKSATLNASAEKAQRQFAEIEGKLTISEKSKLKITQEKDKLIEKSKWHDLSVLGAKEKIEKLSKEKAAYEQKRENAVDRICAKWEKKIEKNNDSIGIYKEEVDLIKGDLELTDQNIAEYRNGIKEFKKTLEGGVPVKTLKKEIKAAVKEQEKALKELEKQRKRYNRKKEDVEFLVAYYKDENKKQEENIGKYRKDISVKKEVQKTETLKREQSSTSWYESRPVISTVEKGVGLWNENSELKIDNVDFAPKDRVDWLTSQAVFGKIKEVLEKKYGSSNQKVAEDLERLKHFFEPQS